MGDDNGGAKKLGLEVFGAASRASSVLRQGLLPRARDFMDQGFHLRLLGTLRHVIDQCLGDPSLQFHEVAWESLNGMPLRKDKPLADYFPCSFELVHTVKRLVLRVPALQPVLPVGLPKATHWRLVLVGRPVRLCRDGLGGDARGLRLAASELDFLVECPAGGFQSYYMSTFPLDGLEWKGVELYLDCLANEKGKAAPDYVVGVGIEFVRQMNGGGLQLVRDGGRMELFLVLNGQG